MKSLALAAYPVTEVVSSDPDDPQGALLAALGKQGYGALIGRIGEEPIRYLGSGYTGSAFLLPSGRVLKFGNNAELYAADVLMRAEPHANVILILDAFALVLKETGKTLYGVAVIVKESVDQVLDRLDDPDLLRIALDLVGDWEPPTQPMGMSASRYGKMMLETWLSDTENLDLSQKEQSFRDDLAAGIEYLMSLGITPTDLIELSNIGIKDGRAVFFDVMAPETPKLVEGDVQIVWGI
jgi:hypothetical protein